MTKKMQRMVLDVLLTVTIVVSMLIQITGETLHEVVGVAFFAAIVIHLILSFKWMKGSAKLASKGKLKGHARTLAVMAVLLGICIVMLGVSSVMISRILADFGLAPALMSSFWKDVHTVSSYSLSALTVVHLCMHWGTLFSWMKIPYNPERRAVFSAGANALAVVGVGVLIAQCARAMELFPVGDESAGENAEEGDSQPRLSLQDKPQPQSLQQPQKESASDVVITGICPLCKNHCPLSAPLCDRPYKEGIL